MAVIDGKWLSKEGLTYFWSKVKAIFTKQTETNVIANLGAKNLLKVASTKQVLNGVTFTVNDNQTITVNGTASATTTYVIAPNAQAILIPNGNYILSGCPSGGGTTTFDLRWYLYSSGKSAYDQGSGASVTKEGNTASSNIAIIIRPGVTANNLVFKPMLRPAEVTDNTFVPYAPTNRELYEEENQLQASVNQLMGIGKQIPSNADLNAYYDPGVYQILTSAIAQTLANSPSNCKVAGSIEVKVLNGSGRIQFYYPNWASSGTNPGSFYFRQRTGATAWSSWYYFSGTVVANASLQSLNSPMTLDLNRNDLNESIDTSIESLDSIETSEE